MFTSRKSVAGIALFVGAFLVLGTIGLVALGLGVAKLVHGHDFAGAGSYHPSEVWMEAPVNAVPEPVAERALALFQEADHPASPPRAGEPPKAPAARKPKAAPPMKDLRLKDEESAEERIESELFKPTEVRFDETPLEDALSFLMNRHHIHIWIDRKSLTEAGISLDSPVTLSLADVRFASVLNLILDPHRLEWLIQDEVLKITTRQRALDLAETQTFDVQNLIDAGHTPEELIGAIVSCVEPKSWSDFGGEGSIAHSGNVLICRQSQRIQSAVEMLILDLDDLAEAQFDDPPQGGRPLVTLKVYRTQDYPADELARALLELVAPDTWGKEGVSVKTIKGALLVQQMPHVHREIDKVLKQLLPPSTVDPVLLHGEEVPAASTSRLLPQARRDRPTAPFRVRVRTASQRRA